MNDAGSHSKYFEQLCALAAIGQISEPEFVELSDHMRNCIPCKSIYGDFIDLVHNKLPLADPELTGSFKLGRPSLQESSYRERFVARARKEGLAVSSDALRSIPESRPVSSWFLRLSFAQVAPLVMALLVLTAGGLGYAWRQSNARNATLEAKLAAADGQIRPPEKREPGPTQRPPQNLPESRPQSQPLPLNAVREPAVAPTNPNDAELSQLRQDYTTALEKANALEKRVQEISGELQIVKGESEEKSDAMTRLQKSLKSSETERDRAIGDLQGVIEGLGEFRARIADLSRENQELKTKLNPPTQVVRRSNVLFSPGRVIGDQLMDLRSVDIYDIGSNSKQSKASARVFYTEGKSKSLLIIATGLSKRIVGKDVFQVWGARGISGTSPRSLGHFELDNKDTDLWALAVNDPAKLEGVDTVFVTLEKGGESEKPTTDIRIMYAFLPQIPVKR